MDGYLPQFTLPLFLVFVLIPRLLQECCRA